MDGLLIVNKPRGITSFQVVKTIRRMTKIKKVGHGGTLDPLAEGVLLIFLGRATKKTGFFLGADKGYFAEMVLGVTTDTFDSDGRVENRSQCDVDIDRIKGVLGRYLGEVMQVPPMFSAKRHKGQRLYKLARAGVSVKREPRKINIYKIELINYFADDPPRVQFGVYCSKGTYIRTLVSDIGEELGCGAHLSRLVRTYSHPFVLSQALSLETLENLVKLGRLGEVVLNVDEILGEISKERINEKRTA